MRLLRTPDERFANLPGYPFAPHYMEIPWPGAEPIRVHFVDEGPSDAAPVLMLHGEPSWSYLYRKVIPVVTAAGLRAVAPDLVGFGRSDKPADQEDYTYQRHVAWMAAFISALDLKCQDWGGLIGLRLVAEHPHRFARVVAANTFLPTGHEPTREAFLAWRELSQTVPELPVGKIVRNGCAQEMPRAVAAAYDAPYPDESFKAGARRFPMLVPTTPDDPAAAANQRAWEVLSTWKQPFLTAFGDSDPITHGADRALQRRIPGCQGQRHVVLERAGHFLQEDVGEELGRIVVEFARTPAG